MGVVFEAERDDGAFAKRVALKVAAFAAWSPEFLHRFRDERQILARLEHPHIARLLDGGTSDDGVPYFAMEFVEGVPITDYAAARRRSVAERLRLFLQVCDAVEYAHQNLVIHRDLKPGNILVAGDSVQAARLRHLEADGRPRRRGDGDRAAAVHAGVLQPRAAASASR